MCASTMLSTPCNGFPAVVTPAEAGLPPLPLSTPCNGFSSTSLSPNTSLNSLINNFDFQLHVMDSGLGDVTVRARSPGMVFQLHVMDSGLNASRSPKQPGGRCFQLHVMDSLYRKAKGV